jgi:hypothetical protein
LAKLNTFPNRRDQNFDERTINLHLILQAYKKVQFQAGRYLSNDKFRSNILNARAYHRKKERIKELRDYRMNSLDNSKSFSPNF